MEFRMSRSMFEAQLKKASKTILKHTILDLGHAMEFKVSMSMFEAKLKTAHKTLVKHMLFDLGHALLTHHEAQRIHTTHGYHLEGSGEKLGASCGQSGSHLGTI